MQVPDFAALSLAFVRENHCASSCPVDLVKAAMEKGAEEAVKMVTERLRKSVDEVMAAKSKSNGKRI